MKYAIPLGATLLIGIGAFLHRAPLNPVPQGRPGSVQQRVIPRESVRSISDSLPMDIQRCPDGTRDEPLETVNRTVSPVMPARSPVPSWWKISSTLESTLALSDLQRPQVEDVLRRREDEIREGHDAIRRAGVLDFRAYEWQIGLLKAGWFKKIDALLDGSQHQKFVHLVEQGLFNEGLGFTLEPGMTVLE